MQNSRLQIFIRSAHPSINRAALTLGVVFVLALVFVTDSIQLLPLAASEVRFGKP